MKKFISPAHDGGLPVYSEDIITIIQNGLWNGIEKLLSGLGAGTTRSNGQPLVIFGMVGSNYNAGANTIDVSAGYAFINGKICFYSGGTGLSTTTGYLIESAATITNRVFKDGSTNAALTDSSIAYDTVIPAGTVQYMEVSHWMPVEQVTDPVWGVTRSMRYSLSRVMAYIAEEVNLPFDGTKFASSYATMRLGQDGFVNLTGKLTGIVNADLNGVTVGTITANLRPNHDVSIPVTVVNESSGVPLTEACYLHIYSASGVCSVLASNGSTILTNLHTGTGGYISLEGARYLSKFYF